MISQQNWLTYFHNYYYCSPNKVGLKCPSVHKKFLQLQ